VIPRATCSARMQNFSEVDEDRRVSFNAGAERYDAVRSSYPDVLADDVLARAGRRVLAIAEAIERHGGTIEIPYVSMACLAKRI